MPFPESVREAAFRRSGGRCECTLEHRGIADVPHHGGRCPATFGRYSGNWHAHHKVAEASGGDNTLSNCLVLCLACHHATRTYGR